jgi:hypothetical protein
VTNATTPIRREAMERQRSANAMLLAAARKLATCQKLLKPPMSPLEMLNPLEERGPARQTNRFQGGGRLKRDQSAATAVAN